MMNGIFTPPILRVPWSPIQGLQTKTNNQMKTKMFNKVLTTYIFGLLVNNVWHVVDTPSFKLASYTSPFDLVKL